MSDEISRTKEISNELEDLKKTENIKELNQSLKEELKPSSSKIELVKTLAKIPGAKEAVIASLPVIGGVALIVLAIVIIFVVTIVLNNYKNQGLIERIDLALTCGGTPNIDCINKLYDKSVKNQESRYTPSELE